VQSPIINDDWGFLLRHSFQASAPPDRLNRPSYQPFEERPAMLRLVPCFLASSLFFFPPLFSEPSASEAELPEMVVTATKTERSIREVGSSVTLITEEEIERRGKVEVSEILRGTPGLAISGSRAAGRRVDAYLRGANPSHTVVFVDGVPVNSTTSGAFDFTDLELLNIESIEVLRGPQSTLYGSTAIGGVISITTKKGEGPFHGDLSAEYGSFNTHREVFRASGGNDEADFSVGIANTMSDGINIAEGSKHEDLTGLTHPDRTTPAAYLGEDDAYEAQTGSTRVGFNVLEDGRLDFTLRWIEALQEGDDSPINPADLWASYDFLIDDPTFEREQNSQTLSLVGSKPLTERWEPSLRFAFRLDEMETRSDRNPDVNEEADSQTFNAELQNDVTVTDSDQVTFGIEYESEQADIEGNYDKSTCAYGLYLQNQLTLLDALHLVAGVRYDDHSTAGDETTYRFTAAYLLDEFGTKLHGSVGTGFRTPTLNSLFYTSMMGQGNPDLKPEKSLGFDIGIEQRFFEDRIVADVTYFKNEVEDLIDWAPVGGVWMPSNVGMAEIKGVESSVRAEVMDRLALRAAYTYMNTEDRDEDRPLRRRPRHTVAVGAALDPTDKLAVDLNATIVRSRIDTVGGARRDMDNFYRVDLTTSYEILDSLQAQLRIENLTDYDYEESMGYQSPGIGVYGGLTWRF